jgi:hypothetical protein
MSLLLFASFLKKTPGAPALKNLDRSWTIRTDPNPNHSNYASQPV